VAGVLPKSVSHGELLEKAGEKMMPFEGCPQYNIGTGANITAKK